MRDYPGPLIRADARNPAPTYKTLLDNPGRAADREFAERLWSTFWPYADSEFYANAPHEFVPRFWEMDPACELLARGFVLEERRRNRPHP